MKTISLLLTAGVACAWSSPVERNNGGEGHNAAGSTLTAGGGDGGPDLWLGQNIGSTNARGSQAPPSSTAPSASETGLTGDENGVYVGDDVTGDENGVPVGDDVTGDQNGVPVGDDGDGAPINFPAGPGIQEPQPNVHFEFLSPTVDFQPEGQFQTSNLNAFAEQGPANVSVSAAGSGMRFVGSGDRSQWTVYVNGTAGDQLQSTAWGKNAAVDISVKEADHPAFRKVEAFVSGLDFGWYEFTLGSSGNLSFDSAATDERGARWQYAPANGTKVDESEHVTRDGDWQAQDGTLRTTAKGAKLTIKPPGATAMLELQAGQPPVPFADFRVTITPPPPYGPAVQEFHPSLKPAMMQAANYVGRIPIFQTVLDPNFDYSVVVETIGDGGEAFSVHDVFFYP